MAQRGRVKLWKSDKGYGFIETDHRGPDVFVHATALPGKGHKELVVGERLEFEVEATDRGLQARDVRQVP